MKKSDLVSSVSEGTGIPQSTVKSIIDATFDTMSENLKSGSSINIPAFGTFSVETHAERKFYNIQTKTMETAPARRAVKFSPCSALKNIPEEQ